jgi:hypothetical protein
VNGINDCAGVRQLNTLADAIGATAPAGIHQPLADYRKCVRIERDIDRAPPDIVLRRALFDDAFVFGRTPGLDAGICDERTVLSNMGIFLMNDGMFVEAPASFNKRNPFLS